MIEIKAPGSYHAYREKTSVFLAGSIEMGAAEEWQKEVVAGLQGTEALVLNPRREQWKPGWEQSINNPTFREQVEWELKALEDADIILVYYSPNTKAPITMLELGLHARTTPGKIIVCCPEGFWRKGNVDIVCQRYGVQQIETLPALIRAALSKIASL